MGVLKSQGLLQGFHKGQFISAADTLFPTVALLSTWFGMKFYSFQSEKVGHGLSLQKLGFWDPHNYTMHLLIFSFFFLFL